MIVFTIKSCFFFKANKYSLGQKTYTLHFFFLFYGEMIMVISAIFAVAIKDLEICFTNVNLFLEKSAIYF